MSGIVLSASVRQNLLSLQDHRRAPCPPPRIVRPPVTRSIRLSTIPPTSSPRRASTTVPATSTTCSTASVTACRCCRRPTRASPRCRSLVDTAKSIANQVLQAPTDTVKVSATSLAPAGAGPLSVAGNVGDLTNAGSNCAQRQLNLTIFTPATGCRDLRYHTVMSARLLPVNVNSIDAFQCCADVRRLLD